MEFGNCLYGNAYKLCFRELFVIYSAILYIEINYSMNKVLQLLDSAKYSDLFSNINGQLHIKEAFQAIMEARERLQATWYRATSFVHII